MYNIPLGGTVTAGVFGEMRRQPAVNRILDTTPVSAAEYGRLRNVYNAGASLRLPLWAYGENRSREFLLTLKAGRKNTGWLPGEYIKGSFYMETGIGLHL